MYFVEGVNEIFEKHAVRKISNELGTTKNAHIRADTAARTQPPGGMTDYSTNVRVPRAKKKARASVAEAKKKKTSEKPRRTY